MGLNIKKIIEDLENKGFSGPYPFFKKKELELINRTVLLKTKEYFKDKIKLGDNLERINHKLLGKNYMHYLLPHIRPKLPEFSKSKKILNLISKILETKNPKICEDFIQFRGNYLAPDFVKGGGGRVGWHQDAQTLFLFV